MCCLHTNGADTGGFEGCYTCVAKVIEDLVTDDATCESLATTVSRFRHTSTTLFVCFNISRTRMLLLFIFSTHVNRPSARTFMHASLEMMPSAPVRPVLPNLRPTESVPKRKSVPICAPALSTLALTWRA